MLETQVLLQHMPTNGGRRRALGQGKVRDLPAGLPSSLFPLLVSSSPLRPKAKFACLGNRAAANLRQRSQGGSNINFKSARAEGSWH